MQVRRDVDTAVAPREATTVGSFVVSSFVLLALLAGDGSGRRSTRIDVADRELVFWKDAPASLGPCDLSVRIGKGTKHVILQHECDDDWSVRLFASPDRETFAIALKSGDHVSAHGPEQLELRLFDRRSGRLVPATSESIVAWEFAWLTPDRVIVIGPEDSARDVVKAWRSPLRSVEDPRRFGFEVDYVAYVLELSTRRGVALFQDRAGHRDPMARLELRDPRARVECAAILDPQTSSTSSANGCAALILTMGK